MKSESASEAGKASMLSVNGGKLLVIVPIRAKIDIFVVVNNSVAHPYEIHPSGGLASIACLWLFQTGDQSLSSCRIVQAKVARG